ncbi:MAG: ABC transporter permease [Candidatus Omnitrophota bacterium]
MEYLLLSIKKAILLLAGFDPEIARIVWTSVWVSAVSIAAASMLSVPAACLIAAGRFPGKRVVITALNTLMSLPTVVAGLLVYSFFCRRGVFGGFGILYTPLAMIIGQTILAFPIITGLTVAALEGADPMITRTARTLGATGLRPMVTLAREMRLAILAAVVAGFGRIFAEIGVSMMLGGNIKHYTRNITTAIAFETGKGEFSLGLALGGVLLACAFVINMFFQGLRRSYEVV